MLILTTLYWEMFVNDVDKCASAGKRASKHVVNNPIFSHESWQKPSWNKSFPFWYSMCWQRPLGSLWWNGNQTHGLGEADAPSVLVMNKLPPLSKMKHIAQATWLYNDNDIPNMYQMQQGEWKWTLLFLAACFLDYCNYLYICEHVNMSCTFIFSIFSSYLIFSFTLSII